MTCKCQICSNDYKVDLLVPNEIWEQIKPEGANEGQGLLCPNCIIERFHKLEGDKYSAWDLIKNPIIRPAPRPETLKSKTTCVNTGFGKLYVTICYGHDGRPFEIFAIIGKSGHELTAMTEGIGRLVSLWLRSGGDVGEIVKQLKGIGGESPHAHGKKLILSVPDGIGQLLEKESIKPKQQIKKEEKK